MIKITRAINSQPSSTFYTVMTKEFAFVGFQENALALSSLVYCAGVLRNRGKNVYIDVRLTPPDVFAPAEIVHFLQSALFGPTNASRYPLFEKNEGDSDVVLKYYTVDAFLKEVAYDNEVTSAPYLTFICTESLTPPVVQSLKRFLQICAGEMEQARFEEFRLGLRFIVSKEVLKKSHQKNIIQTLHEVCTETIYDEVLAENLLGFNYSWDLEDTPHHPFFISMSGTQLQNGLIDMASLDYVFASGALKSFVIDCSLDPQKVF